MPPASALAAVQPAALTMAIGARARRHAIQAVCAASAVIAYDRRTFATAASQDRKKALEFQVNTPLRFVAEGVCHGEASKIAEGRKGEDAMLLHNLAVGVADGVGGWSEVGVDSSAYSNQLLENTRALVEHAEDENAERTVLIHPWALLRQAHAKTKAQGSSTVCIAVAGPDGSVHVANLGDSGCQHWRHVRPAGMLASGVHFKLSVAEEAKLWECKGETKVQQDGFNTPKQLAASQRYSNDPREADVYSWPAQPGDLVIAVTDGVRDNLTQQDVRQALATVDWSAAHTLARMRRLRYMEALKIERSITASPTTSAPGTPDSAKVAGKGKPLERFNLSNAVGDDVDVSNAAVKAKEAEVRAVLKSLASKIAADAIRVGNDKTRTDTPFAKAARAGGFTWTGGKPDDVTVAVGLVLHDDSPSAVEAVVAAEHKAASAKA